MSTKSLLDKTKHKPITLGGLVGIICLGVICLVGFILVLSGNLSLSALKGNSELLLSYLQKNPILFVSTFTITYTAICATPLPLVALLTIAAGFFFGTNLGLLIASIASVIGAMICFFFSRYLMRDKIEKRYGDKLEIINRELDNAGFWYATGVRLIPGVPFFVANICFSVSNISGLTFYFSTQIGMIATLFLLVNAGSQLASISSIGDIFSTQLVLAFALIGLAPFVFRFISSLFIKAN